MESIIYHPEFLKFVFYLGMIGLLVMLLCLAHEVISRQIDKRIRAIRRRACR